MVETVEANEGRTIQASDGRFALMAKLVTHNDERGARERRYGDPTVAFGSRQRRLWARTNSRWELDRRPSSGSNNPGSASISGSKPCGSPGVRDDRRERGAPPRRTHRVYAVEGGTVYNVVDGRSPCVLRRLWVGPFRLLPRRCDRRFGPARQRGNYLPFARVRGADGTRNLIDGQRFGRSDPPAAPDPSGEARRARRFSTP
jgi:hypothetical protein